MECSVCFEAFDQEVRRPKCLPCGHTFCLPCLQNPNFGNVCPQDRKTFRGEPANFPDNFALLADMPTRTEAVWCETCRRQFSGDCADASHRPCSMRLKRALQEQRGANVQQRVQVLETRLQDALRELQELRGRVSQVEDQQQRLPAPARLELDVAELSKREGLLKQRNDLLLGNRLAGVRKLTGLSCSPYEDWSEAVLRKIGPHVEELDVKDAGLEHLRVIQGMSALRKLGIECYSLDPDVSVPTLPLQLEELRIEEFRKEHLLSVQWMPKLRKLNLLGYSHDALDFTPAPDHCGLQTLHIAMSSFSTVVSLVRANAASLSELQVACASRPGPRFVKDVVRRLYQCGAVALRKLILHRNPPQHEVNSCRQQRAAFRGRFGPGVDVLCTMCDWESC